MDVLESKNQKSWKWINENFSRNYVPNIKFFAKPNFEIRFCALVECHFPKYGFVMHFTIFFCALSKNSAQGPHF